MFSLLSILIHIINSIFSGVYTSQFLRSKQNKKATIILWTLTYFVVQMVIFEVIQSRYPFNDVASAVAAFASPHHSCICLLLSLVRMTGREKGAARFPAHVSVGGRRRGLAAMN